MYDELPQVKLRATMSDKVYSAASKTQSAVITNVELSKGKEIA